MKIDGAWNGAKLLCALAQYSYWFLAVRADLHVSSSRPGSMHLSRYH